MKPEKGFIQWNDNMTKKVQQLEIIMQKIKEKSGRWSKGNAQSRILREKKMQSEITLGYTKQIQ